MTKIVATRSDGGLSIFEFVSGSMEAQAIKDAPDQLDVIVAAEIAAWEQSANGVKITSWRRHPDGVDLPDRTFRNAWIDDGKTIAHDMAKARDIWRNTMRAKRKPLLAALDIEYQRADERADAAGKADVAKRKQALRDVTAHPGIETAATPDDLRKVWPEALGALQPGQ